MIDTKSAAPTSAVLRSRRVPFILLLGGTGSGKSARAERLAEVMAASRVSRPCIFVTASEAHADSELQDRIRRHRRHRDHRWQVFESADSLIADLSRVSRTPKPLVGVIDSLGLWLSYQLSVSRVPWAEDDREPDGNTQPKPWRSLKAALDSWCHAGHAMIIVSEEAGTGGIPADPLARRFLALLSALNRNLACRCDHVDLLCAGLPIHVKGHTEGILGGQPESA